MILKLALRNLFRNRWRSALTAGGIATAVFMLVWTIGMIDGMMMEMIRSATSVELGQIQIHETEYAEDGNTGDAFAQSEELLESVRSTPGVDGATSRCHTFGLIGHEVRSQVARVVGVSPSSEAEVTRLVEGLIDGRWLNDTVDEYRDESGTWIPREVVLASEFAQQLNASVGDEMAVMTTDWMGFPTDLPVVVIGIVQTNNSMIDRMTAYMHLIDVQWLTALDGRIHEIAIRADDYTQAPQIALAVGATLSAHAELVEETLVVRAWQDLLPEVASMLEMYDMSIGITCFMIFIIVALGILNSQRMSALERRREFGVLKAIGLPRWTLAKVIIVETVMLSLVGAVIGAIAGYGLTAYHEAHGFDMSIFTEDASFTAMGISFSGRFYTAATTRAVMIPLVWTVGVAFLCGLWPAIYSLRLKETQAISGRTD